MFYIKNNLFHIYSDNFSYIFFVNKDKRLIHSYYGKNLNIYDYEKLNLVSEEGYKVFGNDC